MAFELERIFSLLLSPDTQLIRQATAELQSIHKDPALIGALCEVLLKSENPHARQLSAVLLRKKLGKVWKKLSVEERDRFKAILIQSLTNEFHHLVLRSVANLVSVIANYEFTHGQWTELWQFLTQCCQSDNPNQREIGMLVLSSVLDAATLQLQPQFPQLLALFSSALEDSGSKAVPFYALQSLTAMVEYISDDETPLFRQLIPKSMEAIKRLILADEDKACEAMDLFDELIEIEVGVVVPYLQPLIEFCLEIGSNVSLGDGIRVRALTTIMWLVSAKKKSVLKKGLLPSLLTVLLNIMVTYNSQSEQDEEDDEDFLEDRSQLPHSVASQVIDRLALCLPPEKIFTPLLQYVEPWLQVGSLPAQRTTALTTIAVMSEGCAEIIKKSHLSSLVRYIYMSLQDANPRVRNAALFALGQFSEHLQPEIVQFSSDLLPALFQFLEQATSSPQLSHGNSNSVTRIFYALETFCENLGNQLLSYLPGLMEKLFLLLVGDYSLHYKELAISCIGAIANAVEAEFAPYFPKTMEVLKEFISIPYQQELVLVQAQAIDTLGVLANTVGHEAFRPIAEECLHFGLALLQNPDPDLRRSVYGMLASLSGILKEQIVPHLQPIISRMVECLQSKEGIKAKYSSYAVNFLDFEDEQLEGEESGVEDGNESQLSLEDDQDIEGYTVENAYLEEKEDACNAIGEIAKNLGVLFMPFIDDCFKEINVLTEDSTVGIRKASIVAISELSLVWYDPTVVSNLGKDEKFGLDKLMNATLLDMSAGARTDVDSSVVVATLENLEKMLKALHGSGFIIEERVVESLLVTVDDILGNKAQCQEEEEDEIPGGFDSGEIAEMDGLVLESAGCLLGPLAKLVGGANILNALKPLIKKLVSKITVNSPFTERSFVLGTLAEIVDGCGSSSQELVDSLYPVFMMGVSSEEDEVISNSVYGLGVLVAHGVPKTAIKYPEVLQTLFTLVQSRQNGRLIDNICAAVCRMIVSHRDGVPLDQVVPVLLQNLPLKQDYEENGTVYKCLLGLVREGETSMINNMDLVLKAFAMELAPSSKLSDGLKNEIMQVTQALSSQCNHQFQVAISSLPHPQAQILVDALSSFPILQNGIEPHNNTPA